MTIDRSEILKLKEKRANLVSNQTDLVDRVMKAGGTWSAEDDATHDRRDKEIEEITKSVERSEKLLEVDIKDKELVSERQEKTGTPIERYNEVFAKYIRSGMKSLNPSEVDVLSRQADTSPEVRALGTTSGAVGGFTVPEGFWNRIVEVQKKFGSVASVANVITTDTGNDLPWMTNDDTGNIGSILAENTQISEEDVTFGSRNLGAYLYTSKLVKVSYQLMQDSAIDLEGFLARKLGERLGRIHNLHQTLGTGTNQPDGIVTGATTGVTAASNSAITYDEIVDLEHSVDPAWRTPSAGFMFSDDVFKELRKLRDDSGGSGVGRPLWEPSVQVGAPSLFNGRSYEVNQDMAAIGATNTSMLYGDFFSGYVVRNVKGLSVMRLDERYADFLQVGWFAFDRQDSTKDEVTAYKALVHPA